MEIRENEKGGAHVLLEHQHVFHFISKDVK